MSIIKPSWHLAFLLILTGFLASGISIQTHADAAADWNLKSCSNSSCHGPDPRNPSPFNINLNNYTNATLRTKIEDDMPRFNSGLGTDPSQCEDDCAIDMANYLLPPTPGTPPIIVTQQSGTNVGAAPLDASFSARLSKCDATPCTLVWDFGGGVTTTQTESVLTDLPPVTHTYNTPGPHPVEITMTDFLGQEDTAVIYAYVTTEESLADYVSTCKEELEFNDNDIPNDLNCANGFLFGKNNNAINDFVDHRAITGSVDLVFACRWLQNGTGVNETDAPPFIMARSIELLLHNRDNGNTCFFRAREQAIPVTAPFNNGFRTGSYVNIVSPTVAAAAAPGTPEADYWIQPMELAQEIPCVDCHVAGPYIASPRIAPFLKRFGLLNDGHDTFGRQLFVDETSDGNYHVVGETLGFMNHLAAFNNNQDTCANSCHSIGTNSAAPTIVASFLQGSNIPVELIPSISAVISSVQTAGVMPANNPTIGNTAGSHYTWINRDNPNKVGSQGDNESFAEAKKDFEELLNYCEAPGDIYAHVVGSDEILLPQPFSDRLSVFNPLDGVVCLKSEQSDGQCNDFRVRYQCRDSAGNTSLTNWYNTDSPDGQGDFERRSNHANVCTGKTVVGIEASSRISTSWTGAIKGPVDRLAQFDRFGIVCNNSDQIDGKCENYAVKFISCSAAPLAYNAKLRSEWSGRLLTDGNAGNDALARAQPQNNSWNTQNWVLEPVLNTGLVRIKNLGTGRYLNSQDNVEFANIVTYDYVGDWGSQQWIVEPIFGSANVRFKNVWTGKYLTVNDNGDYSPIKSQALNPDWPSQRWQVIK